MRRSLPLTACMMAGAVLLLGSPAKAVDVTTTHYEFDLTAIDTTTTISFGGYQITDFEYVSGISVTRDGGANLLDDSWTPPEGDSFTLPDGTASPALWFAGTSQEYDTFSQTFATAPYADYVLDFYFTSSLLSTENISALRVMTSASAPSVPELSTWAMALCGFLGLGLTGYRRQTRLDRSSV
jgi:hypothetical protein